VQQNYGLKPLENDIERVRKGLARGYYAGQMSRSLRRTINSTSSLRLLHRIVLAAIIIILLLLVHNAGRISLMQAAEG
jgi:hypothetical protein